LIRTPKVNLKNFDNPEHFYYTTLQVLEIIKKFSIIDKFYPKLVKENIMETFLKKNYPENISFLRMDTNLYKTTKLNLEILYPRLVSGGVLHIDDYGHC